MTDILLSLLVAGSATYYNPGIMDEVYRNRLAWGQIAPCAECVGYVALLDADMIGQRVYLQRDGKPPEGPFLAIDTAAAGHRADLLRRGWAVDVDWPTAQRWGMRGPIPVRVWQAANTPHEANPTSPR